MFGLELLLGSWAITGFIGFTTLMLLYWYSTKNQDYWKKQNITYIKPWPLLGNLLDLLKMPTHELESKRYLKYGPIYGHFEGNKPLISVGDPVLLRDIFVKDFANFTSRRVVVTGDEIFDNMLSFMKGDEEWKRVRSIITPTFTTGKIKRMLSIFKDSSSTLIKNFRVSAMERKPIDAKSLYGAFTMDVIASTAFSTKIDSHNDPNNKFVENSKKVFMQTLNWKLFVFICFPSLLKVWKVDALPRDVMDFFKTATLQIIEERKKTGQVRNDFLQLLLDTAKEVAEKEESPEKEDITSNYGVHDGVNSHIFKGITSKSLSMEEVVAQCVVFFIGGYETTASTLSYATYLLALNSEVQERVRTDVDEALKESEGELTYEALKSMKYLDNVITETLRLYPPITRTDRMANADYTIGDTGITLKKGMMITIPIYAMQRDPNLFPDPEKFDPDRFTPEEKAKRDPFTYVPFGAGPRSCIAIRFAHIEVKVCLAHVIANFNIKTCPETKDPLEYGLGQRLLQPQGIILEMEIREDSPLTKQ